MCFQPLDLGPVAGFTTLKCGHHGSIHLLQGWAGCQEGGVQGALDTGPVVVRDIEKLLLLEV